MIYFLHGERYEIIVKLKKCPKLILSTELSSEKYKIKIKLSLNKIKIENVISIFKFFHLAQSSTFYS